MRFEFTKTFNTSLKMFINQPNRMRRIALAIEDFQNYLFESKYYRKPFQGAENIHELEVGGDVRMLVHILIKDDVTYFLNIGTHSSLGMTGEKKKKQR